MSGKPIWENRFRGLVSSINSHRQANHSELASMTVDVEGEKINTIEYWKEIGKYEFFKTLKRICENYEQANWF